MALRGLSNRASRHYGEWHGLRKDTGRIEVALAGLPKCHLTHIIGHTAITTNEYSSSRLCSSALIGSLILEQAATVYILTCSYKQREIDYVDHRSAEISITHIKRQS